MAHNCVDWTAQPPARKTSLLVLTHGNDDVYTIIPKELKTLEEIARKEFNLGDVDIHFLSTCASLCHGKPARITADVWEHINPYIGCATVKTSRPRAEENQPQAGPSRLDVASETTGDEQYFSAKRKLPSDADENEQQMLTDTTSDHGNDQRTSATEDEEEQASASPFRPRIRRRVASEEEDEQEQHEPVRPPQSPIASPTLSDKEIKKERVGDAPSASQSAEPLHRPDIQIKQEKRTSESGTQSTHDETDTQTQVDSGETQKLMIRVAHRSSNQEAKFMTKSTTSVGKVLAGACKSFSLDLSLATLYLIVAVDEGGNMMNLEFPCDKNDTIARAGAESDSEARFILKMAGEA